MQVFEAIFVAGTMLLLARLLVPSRLPRIKPLHLAAACVVILGLGLILEGYRWQVIPLYFGFGGLVLASNRRRETKQVWRIIGFSTVAVLISATVIFAYQMPVFVMAAPSGPYGVGAFDYSITDNSRLERFAPERNRELFVEVWYPADKNAISDYPVKTLYQELYKGDYSWVTYLIDYLRHIPTHSHVEAPVAQPDERFPVLLFNHGASSFTSQNQTLMEHLVSHGYVIFGISHPYQSIKVNLANAGTIRSTSDQPSDIDFQVEDLERNMLGKIREAANLNTLESSAMRAVLLSLADDYAEAQDDSDKQRVLAAALEMKELRPFSSWLTQESLGEYLLYIHDYQHTLVDYWVKDIHFIADTLPDFEAPIVGFSEVLDTDGFGVFGMSFGGAAAGEFCKLDDRCLAGTNLDGTQFGGNWSKKVRAPFLMFYHEAHQGGNDFAYVPPINDFWDYTVRGTAHFDFTELAHTFPILQTIGMTGSIDKSRMLAIVNEVQLNFFDHYLKGKPVPKELFVDIPEILTRRHEIQSDASP